MRKQTNGNSPQKPISNEIKRQAISLIVNTLIFVFIYFATPSLNNPTLSIIVTATYWILCAGFIIAYVIYNRGFTRKNTTVDMLPSDWAYEKKLEYIEDGEVRLKKSKWMLAIIIPIAITILLDAVYLYTWPMVQSLFNF